MKYDPSQWAAGGGSFVFLDEAGGRWTLLVTQHDEYGISLLYGAGPWPPPRAPAALSGNREEFISVGKKQAMNDFENIYDEIILPVGSFLAPQEAWLAVEDFIESPTTKSTRINWVASKTLAWPKM